MQTKERLPINILKEQVTLINPDIKAFVLITYTSGDKAEMAVIGEAQRLSYMTDYAKAVVQKIVLGEIQR